MFILFPLLVMSVDRIYKGKSPLMFMLIVGVTVGINYYLAFMAAIGIVIYIIFRYFRYHEFNAQSYFSFMGRFTIYGITGIMLSAVYVYVTIMTLSGASTGESPAVTAFYDMAHYYRSGMRLVSAGYTFGYKYIGVPILALLAVPAVKGRPTVRATHVIMAAIMSLMTLSPFFGSMFNGFGYVSNRWYFMLIFFLVWCAAEHMDLDLLAEKGRVIIMLIWWCVLTFTTLGCAYLDISGDLKLRQAAFIGGSLAAGLVMIIFIAAGGKLKWSLGMRQTLVTLMLMGTLVIVWNCSFYGQIGEKFFSYGEIDRQLRKSTQRAGSLIEDDGFYRIDQTDWINSHLKADQPVNENLWWGNNTIYLYDSKIPARLSEFNRLLGNNMGYSKRVYVQSNGNRMGLDFLYGVKYYLGDDELNGRLGADAYAGYAFDRWKNLDGVNVFKSRYDSSLGFVYDKWMTETEFEKLSRLEREQALLQALVVPDSEAELMDGTMEVKAGDIKTDITDVPYEVVRTDGVTVEESDDTGESSTAGSPENGVLIADKKNAAVTIHVSDVPESQLVVSFDNLRRVGKNGENKGNFILKCSNGELQSEANNRKNNQTIAGIVDYDLNMGYHKTYTGDLTIGFSKKGRYEFDRLYVSAMSTANFDKYAEERCGSVYKVTEQESDKVSGTLDVKKDGYLFLSIPVNANWNVYIDGAQVAEIHNANIAFFATPVTQGQHEVELRYDYRSRRIALAITLAGILLMVVLSVIDKINSRRTAAKNDGYMARH